MSTFTDPATARVRVHEPVGVVERVAVRPLSQARAYLAKADADWTWQDLRDLVVHEMEARFGEQLRDPLKEAGIFKAFLSRWQHMAPMIARYAYSEAGAAGWWMGAPVRPARFCAAADETFALPIAQRILDAQEARQQATRLGSGG